ncbi:MAG: SUMF1/EgtB/PvdO family nonheme iron enzyme [Treponema sp.]|jgi:formylglycine-generating enzyme required for sulfatase activity|nr:SUMF1/EgtB/PvdO family nonheme iron enzyme [Treponema sp.]
MKAVVKYSSAIAVLVVLLAGCEFFLGPKAPDVGNVTIRLGSGDSGASRSISQAVIDTLRYEMEFRGPGGQAINRSVPAGTGTISLSLALGEWTVSAEAYTPEDIFAGTGTLTITVVPDMPLVIIPMTAAASVSSKAITTFDITNPVTAFGTINEAAKTIDVTVPFGTDLTNMIPSIAHTGASISPASGTAGNFSGPVTYTVTAGDTSTETYTVTVSILPEYTLIPVPGGTVEIGHDWGSSANYPKPVTVAAFQMGETEITYELWYMVRVWAVNNGYTFANTGEEGREGAYGGAAPTTHKTEPVTNISWRDSVVWCNAYSEVMGKAPYYYLTGTVDFTDSTKVIRESEDNTTAAGSGRAENAALSPSSDGFRLPTEAQWEYAARGGVPSGGAPWTDIYAGTNTPGTGAGELGDYAWYGDNSGSVTHPVKTKLANSLGLYDMCGNVLEWCWDVYSGTSRIYRGGAYNTVAAYSTLANHWGMDLFLDTDTIGLRIVSP